MVNGKRGNLLEKAKYEINLQGTFVHPNVSGAVSAFDLS
jgi:hypothetical protein